MSVLWPDQELQLFKEDLDNMIEDEKLMVSGSSVSRQLIDRSSTALYRMVEHHYELKHMHDIERRQIEEIDKLREKFKDSENKTKHLQNIRKALEDTIAELRSELAASQNESASRKATIETRDRQLDNAKCNSVADKKIAEQQLKKAEAAKDEQIKKLNENIAELKVNNEKMSKAVQAAEKGTNALKNALNTCQETLTDVI